MRIPPYLFLLSILLTLATVAGAETRVALVIGNDAYSTLPHLNNAGRDARGMAARLEVLGFQITLKLNAGRRELHRALDAFEAALRRSDVGLVFYAGHGIQTAQGSNYLIPSDAQVEEEADLRAEGIAVDDVLAVMKRAANALNIIILDACRDNPLPNAGRTARRGLSRTEPPDVRGLAILYSAAAGQVAQDGPAGEHGVFTGELLKVLDEPGLALEEVVRKVNGAVRRRTNGAQRPWSLMSLESAFYFNAAVADPIVSCDRELDLEYWRSVKGSTDPADYEAYLSTCPKGEFVRLARNRLEVLQDDTTETEQPGRRFRDCEWCPEMVVVPVGSYMMGSPPGEKGRDDDEGLQHRVAIAEPFAVGVHEVTRDEFARFVQETNHSTAHSCWVWDTGKREWVERQGRTWSSPGFEQTGRHPVVCVSWGDAQAYVRWLSGKTKQGYRLLSESEWEYVARGGTTSPFHTGLTISTDQANYDGNDTYGTGREGVYRERTVEVGSFSPNAFGLHEVHGNVWEWTQDCWNESYSGAPADGGAWKRRGDCSRRVARGDSWYNEPRYLRSAYRGRNTTGDRNYNLGFRIARTLTP